MLQRLYDRFKIDGIFISVLVGQVTLVQSKSERASIQVTTRDQ